MSKYIITAFFTVLLISVGQLLFKLGANSLGPRLEDMNISHHVRSLISNKYLLFAICVYVLSTVLWIYTLSKIELSSAYIVTSLSFPIVLLLSSIFLGEHITLYKISGVMLIILANIILFIGEK